MIENEINRILFLCDRVTPLLHLVSENDFSHKPAPGKWSKKEILGHLIDSAANNHQRFVRVQFEKIPHIEYNQNEWNKYSYHQLADSKKLVEFWKMYNMQLTEILKNIPDDLLERECNTGKEKNFTLKEIITDYTEHMEYHLKQIVTY